MENFLFYDSERIVAHLERMALKGWQLETITPYYWQYRKCEPREVRYCVTYFSEASEFNPGPTENQQTFLDYCEEAGWKFVTSWAQMQIFSSEEEDSVAVETDEQMKLTNIKRCMWKNFLPGTFVVAALAVGVIAMHLRFIIKRPAEELANRNTVSMLLTGFLLLSYSICILSSYFLWYHRSRKNVENGGVCVQGGRWYQKGLPTILVLMVVLLLYQLSDLGSFPNGIWIFTLNLLLVAGIIWAVRKFQTTLKKMGISRRGNMIATLVLDVVLCFGMMGLVMWGVFQLAERGIFSKKPVTTYTVEFDNGGSWTYDIYHDDLPLMIEELWPTDYEHYSYKWEEEKTLFLHRGKGTQRGFARSKDEDFGNLEYEILDTRIPFVYKLCLEEYLHRYDDWERDETGEPIRKYIRQEDLTYHDESVAVYREYYKEEPWNDYLICLENRIIYLSTDWPLTDEQFAIAVEKLVSN